MATPLAVRQFNPRQGGSGSFARCGGGVIQYSKTGTPLRTYQFNGIFPTEVSSIDLDWNSTDEIERFTVTFQYDWWNVSGGSTGNAGGT